MSLLSRLLIHHFGTHHEHEVELNMSKSNSQLNCRTPKQAACSRESLDFFGFCRVAHLLHQHRCSIATYFQPVLVLLPLSSCRTHRVEFLSKEVCPPCSSGLFGSPISSRGPIYCQQLDTPSQSTPFSRRDFTETLPHVGPLFVTAISLSSRLDLTHILRPRFGMYHLITPASRSYRHLRQYI